MEIDYMEFDGTNSFIWFKNNADKPIPFHGHLWYKGQLEYRNLQETRDIFYSIIGYTMSCEEGKSLQEIYQCLILRCPVFNEVARLLEPPAAWEVDMEEEMDKLVKKIRKQKKRCDNCYHGCDLPYDERYKCSECIGQDKWKPLDWDKK